MHTVPESGTFCTLVDGWVDIEGVRNQSSHPSPTIRHKSTPAQLVSTASSIPGQLRDAGFDRKAVGRRVARSEWIRLAPGVFAVASAPPIWERQLSAAILSRSSAIVGGRSAAFLHGFQGFGRTRPEIMVPWVRQREVSDSPSDSDQLLYLSFDDGHTRFHDNFPCRNAADIGGRRVKKAPLRKHLKRAC